jgi:hypothetical protein
MQTSDFVCARIEYKYTQSQLEWIYYMVGVYQKLHHSALASLDSVRVCFC